MSILPSVELKGVVPVLLASFDSKDEKLLLEDTVRQIEAMKAFGINAVALPMFGTEFYKLDEQERLSVLEQAIAAADGKLDVVANVPYASACIASRWAKRFESMGAKAISFPLPRVMGINEPALFDYSRHICESVSCDILIQDWNPGGLTVGEAFCFYLNEKCPNFRYFKLEEAFSLPKIKGIHEVTGWRVRCLEGWGGLRSLQALEAGVIGIMPGPALADVLQRMMNAYWDGQIEPASVLHEMCLPQMVTALQGSLEFFIILEKYLAWKRGIIGSRHLRVPFFEVHPDLLKFGEQVCDRLLRQIQKAGFELNYKHSRR